MKTKFGLLKLTKKEFIFLIVIISLLKCVLLYVLVEVVFTPHQMVGYVPDSHIYEMLAKNIISGHGFSFDMKAPFSPTMFKEPLYALFVALIYLILAPSFKYIVISQMFLNPFIAILIYLIGREIFEERIARFASLLVSLIPIFGEMSFFIQVEAFYIPLMLFFLYVLTMAFKKNRIPLYLLSGILLGLCSLCRSIVFYLPGVIIILIALGYGEGLKFNKSKDTKRRILKITVFIASFILVVSPWVNRNMKKFKSYQISERGGRILWAQATMAEEFSGRELKAYFLYLISGHLAQKNFPDFIGKDFGDFEYRYFNNAPLEQLKNSGFSDGQIDLILVKEAVKKIISYPLKFIILSSISYLQIFKYFTPWSVSILDGRGTGLTRVVFPAVRFLFGFPVGIAYTLITILGIYSVKRNVMRFLPAIVIIVYYHFILFFLSGVPGSTLQRFVLPVIPLYSFFVCFFIIKVLKI